MGLLKIEQSTFSRNTNFNHRVQSSSETVARRGVESKETQTKELNETNMKERKSLQQSDFL